MFLLLNPTEFHIQYVSFLEKRVNMIMDGFFSKILFSTEFMTMNGITLQLPFNSQGPFCPSSHNFLSINLNNHKECIQRLYSIENHLIQYYKMFFNSNKVPVYSLKSQLQKGLIKYYRDNSVGTVGTVDTAFYLKISGIWENPHEVGITFKFIEYRPIT